jgi:hypothetical protein
MGESQANVPQPKKVMGIVAIVLGAITCNVVALGLGIAGVVLLGQIAAKKAAGDEAGAASSLKTGNILSLIGFILGLIGIVFFIISLITGGLASIGVFNELMSM